MEQRYFEVASPLSKSEFLTVYRESLLLSQLLFAPFGISEIALQVLGESECNDIYTSMFQQVETIVSKRLFVVKRYPEDRVIASMSKYVMGAGHSEPGGEAKPDLEVNSTALRNNHVLIWFDESVAIVAVITCGNAPAGVDATD